MNLTENRSIKKQAGEGVQTMNESLAQNTGIQKVSGKKYLFPGQESVK